MRLFLLILAAGFSLLIPGCGANNDDGDAGDAGDPGDMIVPVIQDLVTPPDGNAGCTLTLGTACSQSGAIPHCCGGITMCNFVDEVADGGLLDAGVLQCCIGGGGRCTGAGQCCGLLDCDVDAGACIAESTGP